MPLPKSTATRHRLPFENLSPHQFEDMCLAYVNATYPLVISEHYGPSGNDGGVDLLGTYIDGTHPASPRKTLHIQAKRLKEMGPKEAEKIVADYGAKNGKSIADEYLLICACDVSRDTYDTFRSACNRYGIKVCKLLSGPVLEEELYSKHPNILHRFFDIETSKPRDELQAKIRHRMEMRSKAWAILREMDLQKLRREVVIRNAHRLDDYPDFKEEPGISPWFRLGILGLYHRGIECGSFIERAAINPLTGQWHLWTRQNELQLGFVGTAVKPILRIPYDNIIEIDAEGDEYDSFPHFFCEFANRGEPYEEVRWCLMKNGEMTNEYLPIEKMLDGK